MPLRICHVTPHLPPDQAANALLPAHLGRWAAARGDEVTYVAHPPRAGSAEAQAGPVVWVEPNQAQGPMRRIGSIAAARRIRRDAGDVIRRSDVVHVHSNGLLAEASARLARGWGKPVVLTLYGTEIWHYKPKAWPFDLFTAAYREAARVTFYSRGLHDKAIEFGLAREGLSVVYPPVVEAFAPASEDERAALRNRLGLTARHVLLNVKRLHPLAGQRYLIDAMPEVLRHQPDTQLVICGTGALLDELRARAASAGAGVAERITFAGLVSNSVVADYNRAADLFILPSLLEALPTVAVEALACGTPVVSADHPGGVELNALFGDDVTVVPREDSARLAQEIIARLGRATAPLSCSSPGERGLSSGALGTTAVHAPGRTAPATADVLTREFRPAAVAARFQAIYDDVARNA
jgi:glycosyltransferase involved in cell wall biosynthesis